MAVVDCRLSACIHHGNVQILSPWQQEHRNRLCLASAAGCSGVIALSSLPRMPHLDFCSINPLVRQGKNAHPERRLVQAAAVPPPDLSSVPIEERNYPDMEDTESEEEARKKNWERGWAPWEEILTPEAQFAIDSLRDGEEFPEVPMESFENLVPKVHARKQRILEEEAAKERKQAKKQVTSIEGTLWNAPLVFTLIPPRDWPPPGWEVDPQELAFIREAHALSAVPVTPHDLEHDLEPEDTEVATPRWNMFVKQYADWFVENKDRLDAEALEVDPEYYPGRRRTGENYLGEWMVGLFRDYKPLHKRYELPFIYPGQHWWGVVTCVNLYEGAFVCIGAVHDAWVPIRDNDWFEIRKYIKVGMHVHVEILAKRDPFRFRFPVEARFVDPNIDSLIFKRFAYPPIMTRPGDVSVDELARETQRPFWPERRPEKVPEDEPMLLVHPYVSKVWQLHVSEQMILDDEEGRSTEYDRFYQDDELDIRGEIVEETHGPVDLRGPNGEKEWMEFPDDDDEDGLPTLKLVTEVSDLDLDAARAERKAINELAEQLGDDFKMPQLRCERRMEELNEMHNQRYQEEEDALVRDITCRLQVGLPLEEPGRYAPDSIFGKNLYDPRDKSWRNDYWGSPSTLKDEAKRDRQPRASRVEDSPVEEEEELEVWSSSAEVDLKDGSVEVDSESDDEGGGGIKAARSSDRSSKGASVKGAVNGIATLRFEDIFNEEDWRVKEDGDEDFGGSDVIDV